MVFTLQNVKKRHYFIEKSVKRHDFYRKKMCERGGGLHPKKSVKRHDFKDFFPKHILQKKLT